MTDATTQNVLEQLHAGHDTANAIRRATGLAIEAVYQALVALEGRGLARVVVTGHQRHTASWGAL